jgi:hypothetical protein
MNPLHVIAAAALCAAFSAHAQNTYKPAVPRGIADAPAPQSRAITQPAGSAAAPAARTVEPTVPKLATGNWRHQHDRDARRCLQFTSNRQIHRCAERYRPHTRATRVKRTKAAKAKPSAALRQPATASASGKADLSKAPAASKAVESAKASSSTAPPPSTASVIQKPSTTPPPAPPAKAAAGSEAKPPKWTDKAKGIVKSQGDHLPD